MPNTNVYISLSKVNIGQSVCAPICYFNRFFDRLLFGSLVPTEANKRKHTHTQNVTWFSHKMLSNKWLHVKNSMASNLASVWMSKNLKFIAAPNKLRINRWKNEVRFVYQLCPAGLRLSNWIWTKGEFNDTQWRAIFFDMSFTCCTKALTKLIFLVEGNWLNCNFWLAVHKQNTLLIWRWQLWNTNTQLEVK